jgi:hypothetical protein
MPYIPFSLSDEEEQKKSLANASQNISGVSNSFVGQGATTTKAPQRSGSFTNLNSYLDANKDNAEGMGNTVAGNITNQGNTARTGITNTQNDFNSMVDSGSLSNLSSAKDEASSITNKAKVGSVNNQINDSEVNRFKDISNATYKGPQSLDASSKYQDTQSSINKANEYKQSAGTDEGRFNLLQSMFEKPTYTQGQKKLDNLLLTGNDKAKTSINNAATSLNDIQGLWDNANTSASTLANDRKTQSNEVKKYAQDYLGSNRDARNAEVNNSLNDVQSKWSNGYNDYSNLLTSGNDPFNKQASDLSTFDSNKVVSKDQFSQLSALDKLAAQYGSSALSRFTDEKQAGTSDLSNNFNPEALKQRAIQNSTNELESSRQAALNAYRARGGAVAQGAQGEANFEYMLKTNPQGVAYYFPNEAAAYKAAQAKHAENMSRYSKL